MTPLSKCRLRQLRLERIKDLLLLEEEFLVNQEAVKPREQAEAADRSQVDQLRGTPMGVGSLEEIIDDNHAIVSACELGIIRSFIHSLSFSFLPPIPDRKGVFFRCLPLYYSDDDHSFIH